MLLSELIFNDFLHVTQHESSKVFSEEAIRLMLKAFSQSNQLINPIFISSAKVIDFFKQIQAKKVSQRYQLLVEFGSRSLLQQGEKGTIHYNALDVMVDDEGKLIVLIADHYYGTQYYSYLEDYQKLDSSIHFIVLGGSLYQADEVSCPIFSLRHLLLTAKDDYFSDKMCEISFKSTEKVTFMPWFDLPPAYNELMQSFTQLTNYVDHQKKKETATLDMVSSVLEEAHFDISLARTLQSNPDTQKIQNKAVYFSALDCIRSSLALLYGLTEAELIKLCYQERYPFVAALLEHERKIAQDMCVLNAGEQLSEPSSILNGLFFSNQSLLNFLAVNHFTSISRKMNAYQAFHDLLNNESLLKLAHLGYADLNNLVNELCVFDTKERKLNEGKLKLISKNIDILDVFVAHWEQHGVLLFTAGDLLTLLLTKNTADLFAIPAIARLYLDAQISCKDIEQIRKDKLKTHNLSGLSDFEILAILRACKQQISPVSIAHLTLENPAEQRHVFGAMLFFDSSDNASSIAKPACIRSEAGVEEQQDECFIYA